MRLDILRIQCLIRLISRVFFQKTAAAVMRRQAAEGSSTSSSVRSDDDVVIRETPANVEGVDGGH